MIDTIMNEKITFGTLDDAIAIAAIVHKGKVDKAGAPYILHPLRLMMRMTTEAEMITAVMHDVVEDSQEDDKWTFERLRKDGFSEEVIEAVDSVTSREGENYDDFIERANRNPIGRYVKIADLEDNMNMLRLGEITSKSLERLARYHRCWKRLTHDLKVMGTRI